MQKYYFLKEEPFNYISSTIIFLVFDFSDFKAIGKCFVDQQEGSMCLENDLSWGCSFLWILIEYIDLTYKFS